jgi:hypothetical protein
MIFELGYWNGSERCTLVLRAFWIAGLFFRFDPVDLLWPNLLFQHDANCVVPS